MKTARRDIAEIGHARLLGAIHLFSKRKAAAGFKQRRLYALLSRDPLRAMG